MFEQKLFWEVVKRNAGKIKEVRFELVTPNMANISGTLSDELKSLAKSTNSAVTTMTLDADPDATLNLDENNPDVKSLVDYASKGGGNIGVRIKGFRRIEKTSKATKTVSIESVEAMNPEMAINVIKSIVES